MASRGRDCTTIDPVTYSPTWTCTLLLRLLRGSEGEPPQPASAVAEQDGRRRDLDDPGAPHHVADTDDSAIDDGELAVRAVQDRFERCVEGQYGLRAGNACRRGRAGCRRSVWRHRRS